MLWQDGSKGVQTRQVVAAQGGGGAQVALAEGGASTASAVGEQPHGEPGRLQHRHRSLPDVGLMVAHKGVVPKNDFPTRAGMRRPARKPVVKPLSSVRGQGAFSGQTKQFL